MEEGSLTSQATTPQDVQQQEDVLQLKQSQGAPGWPSQLSLWTPGFGSGCDLTVRESEPRIRLCADSTEPGWDSLSPSLSAPSLLALYLSTALKRMISLAW